MIFDNDFNDLSDGEIELLNSYFDGYDYQSSSYTYMANYIWRDSYSISWQIIEGYLCVAGLGTLEYEGGDSFMCMPMTNTGSYDRDLLRSAILAAKKKFEDKGRSFEMALIPSSLVPILREAFGDEITIDHVREDDDYIYLKEELATLSGRKYHHKKNHLNYFLKNYQYTYEEITGETVPEVLNFLDEINEEKTQELEEEWAHMLKREQQAIKELLTFIDCGTLLTGAIRIDGKIQAITIGEFDRTNSKESVLVHVEKASSQYRGLYQLINKEFCMRLPAETIYVNREEDMGMETLRQTKLSYKPFKLSEKYMATI